VSLHLAGSPRNARKTGERGLQDGRLRKSIGRNESISPGYRYRYRAKIQSRRMIASRLVGRTRENRGPIIELVSHPARLRSAPRARSGFRFDRARAANYGGVAFCTPADENHRANRLTFSRLSRWIQFRETVHVLLPVRPRTPSSRDDPLAPAVTRPRFRPTRFCF